MDVLYASIALTGALIALVLSIVSLVIHYVRRSETPEYTNLSSQIRGLEAELIDLVDKVKHWRNRDNVRRARQGAEEKAAEEKPAETPEDYKKGLRRKVWASGGGPKAA